MMQTFRLVERELSPECREILVEGEFDLAVAEQLQQALERVNAECAHVLIGLEKCEFIDSTGIAVVVHAHQRFAEEGRQVALYAPANQVLRVLSLTGLTDNGLVFSIAAEALSASRPGFTVDA
jgi:anti-sigma B factor antagonist